MCANNNDEFCLEDTFLKFFTDIQETQLNGFHSEYSQRIKKNYDPLQFSQAKSISLELHGKEANKIKKNWKHNQILLFLYLIDKMCLKTGLNFLDFNQEMWKQISQLIPGRSTDNCKTKILSILPANLNDTPWTEVEQQMLTQIIQKQGMNKWKMVALKLFQKNPTHTYRSSKQCRERYMCYLKPNLKKGFWSDNEDYELIKLFLKYGRKWSKMTQYIQGRNQNAIKNRFFLLFEQNSRNQKLYYSQFMRKVLRRKQKLQKMLGIDTNEVYKEQQQQDSTKNLHEQIQLIKSVTFTTQREQKSQQFADIQQFLTF